MAVNNDSKSMIKDSKVINEKLNAAVGSVAILMNSVMGDMPPCGRSLDFDLGVSSLK